MSRNQLVMVLCVIALAEFVYLGYQIFRNSGPVTMEKETYEVRETRFEKNDNSTTIKVPVEKSVRTEGLNKKSRTGSILPPESPETGQTELKNEKKSYTTALTKQDLALENNPGRRNQDAQKYYSADDPIDPSELKRLFTLVGQNDPEAIGAAMDIAARTSDKRALHGSLQALGRLGTDNANQVLSNAVGKNLDNAIEVIRILSYFNRSVPVEDGIVDQLIEYAESPFTPIETKRVIIKKVVRTGSYGRDRAVELMDKLNV